MNPFQGIQAVSFDVGGTLIDPWPSVGHVYAAVAVECGLPAVDPDEITRRFGTAWRARSSFNYTTQCWADLVVSAFGGSQADFGLESRLFQRLYDRFAQPEVWKIYEDVLPTLQRLNGKGLRLVAVSNWDDRLRGLLRRLNLDVHFETIEVSAESGFHKPSPEIFRRAVAALRVRPEAVLHVGDSVPEDYEGARGAGQQALVLRRREGVRGGHEIGSLAELVERLG